MIRSAYSIPLSKGSFSTGAQDNWPRNVLSVIEQLLLSVSQLHPSHGSPPDISPLTQLQRKLQKLASMPPIMRRKLSFATYDEVRCSATALIPKQVGTSSVCSSLHHNWCIGPWTRRCTPTTQGSSLLVLLVSMPGTSNSVWIPCWPTT